MKEGKGVIVDPFRRVCSGQADTFLANPACVSRANERLLVEPIVVLDVVIAFSTEP